jgi:hypothetical protein
MSYIDSQIRELREIAEMYEGMDGGELLKECADTIESLYKKLNEKSNGGWIPCSERLPEKGVMNPVTNDYAEYLCTVCVDGFRAVRPIKFDKDGCWVNHGMNFDKYVTAWQPLPEAYHG